MGDAVNLTLNSTYICPSNGYLNVFCDYIPGSYAFVSSPFGEIRVCSGASNPSGTAQVVYLRAGMRVVWIDGVNARVQFIPFQ